MEHEKVRHQCPYCDKDFTALAYCEKHIKTCMNAFPVSCEKCGGAFKNVSLLQTHITTHENQCSLCQKMFLNNKSMLQHRAHVVTANIGPML